MLKKWKISALAIAPVLMLGLTACGPEEESARVGSTAAGTGTLDGQGKTLVAFMLTSANSYFAAEIPAMKKEAERLNYKLKIFENNFDQSEEDRQVQQWLATGEQPAAILYQPVIAEASVNSARLLSQRAPVISFGMQVPQEGDEFVKAYAGVSHNAVGRSAGEMALQSLKEGTTKGVTYKGASGKPNLAEISFPSGNLAGIDRSKGFKEVAGDSFNILTTEPASGFDPQAGFAAASQVIPKLKSQGIDYIYAQSNDLAVGVVKALEQNGLTPGKDVTVIAGNLSGDQGPLQAGKIYSAVLQSPVIEGILGVETAAKYLAAGNVKDGRLDVAPDAVRPETTPEAPFKVSVMPSEGIRPDDLSSLKVWGMNIEQLNS